MDRRFFVLGSLLAAASVGLGAFAAHGLRARLSPEALVTFETGVRYHLSNALGILAAAWASWRWPASAAVRIGGWLLVAGILLFSGSLYLLATEGTRWLGPVTPLGGAASIAGWLALAWGALRGR